MSDENNLINIQKKLLFGKQLFDVELTSRCNKNCSICPRENFIRKNIDMTEESFNSLCDWLPENCYVMFAGYGEPLLNKNIYSFISKLKRKKSVVVSVYTNGILLSGIVIEKLFSSGLDLIQVSITDKNDFEQAKKNYSFAKKENLMMKFRFNVLYKNEDDLQIMKKEIKLCFNEEAQNINFKKVHSRGGELYDFNYSEQIKSCGTFFMDTFIDAQGNIQICSNDINGKNKIGNIKDISFNELIKKKNDFFGNKEIAMICRKCSDEYRIKHFEEVRL